ncbi:hypothetical protein [Paenibacillus aestuarii]|uniref:Uncharacterized protein n=1 Tax=Paenibacillus aestuarii TaxID=516965 RepID=A0ABW0KBM5_9BACL|nr:hypothetical protein [Paenibacillus aestuarii]
MQMNIQKELKDMHSLYQALMGKVEAHEDRIQALELRERLPVPMWANKAVEAAVEAGLIDKPEGASYDFYRLLVVLQRRGMI